MATKKRTISVRLDDEAKQQVERAAKLLRQSSGAFLEKAGEERARVVLLSSLVMQGESTSARARAITSDYFYLGRVRSLREIREGVEGVTPEAIVDHLARHPAENFTVTSLGPRKLTVPA